MEQRLDKVVKFPYRTSEYVKRLIWIIVKSTIWRLLWHKIPILRMIALKIFGGQVKYSSMSYGSVNIFRPWGLKIGSKVAIGPRVHIYNLKQITIGDHTVISQDVYLCGGTHDYRKSTLPLIRKDISIGSNVWICAGVFVGPGVSIGDGAIVGARAVVIKDVNPWTIVAGNPARELNKRQILED